MTDEGLILNLPTQEELHAKFEEIALGPLEQPFYRRRYDETDAQLRARVTFSHEHEWLKTQKVGDVRAVSQCIVCGVIIRHRIPSDPR